MLYNAYEMQRSLMSGASAMASVWSEVLSNPANPLSALGVGQVAASALDVFAHAAMPRGKPAFAIDSVEVAGESYSVTESIVMQRPFGNLLRFSHTGLGKDAPKLLIVAPMSGHYATLLRGTVARMVQSSVVYITDWADARQVPLSEGRFDLDDYIDYVIRFLEFTGKDINDEGTHVLAVCQPSVPTYAATAIMGANGHPQRPLTLTMMGGPVDTREAPTSVNDVAVNHPLPWFKHNVIATVPLHYPGAGREVYPGFLQLAGFMSMNLQSHMMSHWQMFRHLVAGDGESADASKSFYEEYRSVCDMTAEFYLQTIEHVFQKHSLPKGEFVHRGAVIDLGGIKDTALLAVEGERDDISGIGQTKAALKLAHNLPDSHKQYLLAEGVGHYGIFNGSKWRNRIAPVLEAWMAQHAKR
ncbi:polyhydroxyalkanoate depolymerase [Novosphingobium umbonatum]|uniref:Polyhydroxyalkanoate depolymerase n=1 Tax=Novosphingobium umbonatum TaxID=1908524 RepID=A0A3S2VC89_9SPHN|nr:polyhydroxyalkanoate depolymerase [Novosphingobium umbonatum]RVU04237.1 polyhydroxyalkanoate depolymerase [Novosphingobium umbonatum]